MRKRIFAAVEISDEARQKAANRIEFLRGRFPQLRVSWDKPEKLHLTLKFFGEIELEKISRVIEAGAKTAENSAAFKIQIEGTGVFPSVRQARILWLGVSDSDGEFSQLHRTFETECGTRGFETEQQYFKPHLTLARLKESADELVKIHLAQNFAPIEIPITEIIIFQSELHSTGAIYTVISRHRLRNARQTI